MKIKKLVLALGGLLACVSVWAAGGKGRDSRFTYETFKKLYERITQKDVTVAMLADQIPDLARNLKIAQKVSAEHWTRSTPYDELAKAYVLPEKVMDVLGIDHPVSDGVMHVPAGTMHSYGYLFSQLQTSFGLKGKRWVESRLDERLGVPAGLFSPYTKKGEFLANVTSALFQSIGIKAKISGAASLKPTSKALGKVTQEVLWQTADKKKVKGTVVTHLVDLKPLAGFETTDSKLLVYETVFDGKHRLVTAFPIDQKFAESILATKPATDTEFKPRFNLYIDPTWTVLEHRNKGFTSR